MGFLVRAKVRRLLTDESALPADVPAGPGVAAGHVVLAVAALLPFILAENPPLYDFYHWLFQGRIVAILLPWGPDDGGLAASAFRLHWGPIPNLAAPLGIGLLDTVLSPTHAARAFAALCAVAFGVGFAFLVRSLNRRPTILEPLGYLWAFGYLLYKGYMSNLLGLALAFFAMGRLARSSSAGRAPTRSDLALVTALGVAAYLCHFFGWLVLLLTVCYYGIALRVREQRRVALRLVSTQVLPILLLVWYVLGWAEGRGAELYESFGDKALSLVSPLMLFVRADPFRPAIPVFWANLAAWLFIGAVVWTAMRHGARPRVTRATSIIGALLLLGGLLGPFATLAGASRPDERLVMGGVIVILAGIRGNAASRVGWHTAVGIVLLVLVYHTYEYRRVSRSMSVIESITAATLPPGIPTYSVTLWTSRTQGACRPESGPSVGEPVLKWFDQKRIVEEGRVLSRLSATSLVEYNPRYHGLIDHWPDEASPDELYHWASLRWQMEKYPALQILGCADDIRVLRSLLHRHYETVAETEGAVVLLDTTDSGGPAF